MAIKKLIWKDNGALLVQVFRLIMQIEMQCLAKCCVNCTLPSVAHYLLTGSSVWNIHTLNEIIILPGIFSEKLVNSLN